MFKVLRPVALSVLLVLSAPHMVAADYGGGNSGGNSSGGSNITVNSRMTDLVIRNLQNDFKECFQLFPAYRYDCYSRSYSSAANRLKGSIDYEPAYKALRLVEERISAQVAANLDPSQKKIRKGFQRFSAVNPDTLPTIKRETIKAMEEAQTLLLRSPAAHQKPHFQKIAAVIDSNKVLLRSALLQLETGLRRLAQLLTEQGAG